jgi:hypothetical protein
MAGNGFSGKSGSASMGVANGSAATTKILEVTKWTLDSSVSVNKYNANTTFGHKKAVPGVRDTKGTIEIKIDGTNGVQIGPGNTLSLSLQINSTNNDYFFIKHAVIVGGPIDCDIDEGAIVATTYAFEASDITGMGILASYGTAGVS